MSLTLAIAMAAAIAVPHVLRLDRASPSSAACIWLAALALRALLALLGALIVISYVPSTRLFALVTQWCWHAVVPLVTAHMPLSGHTLGDAATIVPALVLVASVLSVTAGLWQAAREVRRLVQRAVVGLGPAESLVLADGSVLVAAAGLCRPQVVVSAGALLSFDDEELAASLDHEHGHIARRHRYLLVAAELCRAFARFLPGTTMAMRELLFHLERDADRFALARLHEPAVLASAICKAAHGSKVAAPGTALGGGAVVRRIGLLLEADAGFRTRRSRPLVALAIAMAGLALAAATVLPTSAHASYHGVSGGSVGHRCAD